MKIRNPILDFSKLDFDNVVASLEDLRKVNFQRFEFEQLTAIIHEDEENQACAGYKEVTENEFWTRGHMPGMPVMPGVLICESAAQLCSYYANRFGVTKDRMLGFGGMDKVKFRDLVRPPCRLVTAAKLLKVRPGVLLQCRFQSVVDDRLVCEGEITGIVLPEAVTPNKP